MKSSNYVLLFFFVLLYSYEKLSAQAPSTTLSNITPPSPTAYELGKYGQIQVGLFTGTNSTSIPLYEYRSKNLAVPISLNYSSNGIKVDELGSNVGLSWSLNMGGVITRIVRDLADESQDYYLPEEEIHRTGSLTSPHVLSYFDNAGNNPAVDSESDLYLFNFNGYSGKFVFDNDHKIVMLPKQDLKIETTVINNNKQGFKITTADGTVYDFSETERTENRAQGADPSIRYYESAWYLTKIKHPYGDEITFVYGEKNEYSYVASQQQSLIVVPWQSICEGSTLPVNYATPGTAINYYLSVIGNRLTEIHSNTEQGKVLISYGPVNPGGGNQLISAIKVMDKYNQEIEKFDFTYLTTANKRIFLEKLTTKDPTKMYRLEYIQPEKFPERLSYDQDHWGYCNSDRKQNNYLFPNPSSLGSAVPDEVKQKFNDGANKSPNPAYAQWGLLKRITYPTNGYSEFTYEANTYAGKKTIFLPEVTINMKIHVVQGSDCTITNKDKDTLTIPKVGFDQKVKVVLAISLPQEVGCCDNPMPDKIAANISVEDLTDPSIIDIFSGMTGNPSNAYILRDGQVEDIYASLKAGHAYRFILSSMNYYCKEAFFGITYGDQKPYDIDFNDITGGMRLQKVEVNDGIGNNPQITRYHYAKKEKLDMSTGEVNPVPQYLARKTNRITCQLLGQYQDTYYYELTSSSLNTLYNAINSNTCNYNYVTISHGGDNFENGGEEHEFIIEHDAPGNMFFGANIPSAPWTNFGRFNGKEKTVRIFKNNNNGNGFTLLKEQHNEYKTDDRYEEVVYAYAIQKRCEKSPTQKEVEYTCTADDVKQFWTRAVCIGKHEAVVGGTTITWNHTWNLASKDVKCMAPGFNNKIDTTYHQCRIKGVGGTIINHDVLENLNIIEYQSISRWEYLNASTTITYDQNGKNPYTVKTEYTYHNPEHMQLTYTTTTDSKQTQLATLVRYPQDYDLTGSLSGSAAVMKTMADKHIINAPIEELKYAVQGIENRVLDAKLHTYKMNNTAVVNDKNYFLKQNVAEGKNLIQHFTYSNINNGQLIYDTRYEQEEGFTFHNPNNSFVELTARDNNYAVIRSPNGDVWARTLHANYQDIAYSSFEHDDINNVFTNWFYSNKSIVTLPAFNSTKALKLKDGDEGYVKSVGALSKYQTYKISFWAIDGTVEVNTFEGEKMTSSRVLLTLRKGPTRQGWTYYEGVFSEASFVKLTGTAIIDELRLYPNNARMHTYVYKMGQGIISECNGNNQKTDYFYDDFNRLKLVKDQDGNIQKKNEYQYQQVQQ